MRDMNSSPVCVYVCMCVDLSLSQLSTNTRVLNNGRKLAMIVRFDFCSTFVVCEERSAAVVSGAYARETVQGSKLWFQMV